MILLPAALGGTGFRAWRLDKAKRASTWDSGEGAYQKGGRWNSRGIRAVYCSVDPATAILEVAVHVGFRVLDTVQHVLTSINVDPSAVFVVYPADVPNSNWLRPGIASAGQQSFGDDLLAAHKFVMLPSVVSSVSWNLIFVADRAKDSYSLASQDPFALDPRLNPAK
jgi:RES domain-containing protein